LVETFRQVKCTWPVNSRAWQIIAERLKSVARGDLPWPPIEIERAIPWVEQRTGKVLSASQRKAVDLVLHSKVAVVTGGPGVGKTTLLDTILRVLSAKGVRLLLAAPTGARSRRERVS
jgi:exodeoxyribonuclease V alpha subunit